MQACQHPWIWKHTAPGHADDDDGVKIYRYFPKSWLRVESSSIWKVGKILNLPQSNNCKPAIPQLLYSLHTKFVAWSFSSTSQHECGKREVQSSNLRILWNSLPSWKIKACQAVYMQQIWYLNNNITLHHKFFTSWTSATPCSPRIHPSVAKYTVLTLFFWAWSKMASKTSNLSRLTPRKWPEAWPLPLHWSMDSPIHSFALGCRPESMIAPSLQRTKHSPSLWGPHSDSSNLQWTARYGTLIPIANSCSLSTRVATAFEGCRNADTARNPPLHLGPGYKPPTPTQCSFELPSDSAMSPGVCHFNQSEESFRASCPSIMYANTTIH